MSNISDIEKALHIFEEDMQSREAVNCVSGVQDPRRGYEIKEIRIFDNRCIIEAYFYDRKLRENDEYLREKDLATFYVLDNKVLSQEMYDKRTEMYEQIFDSFDRFEEQCDNLSVGETASLGFVNSCNHNVTAVATKARESDIALAIDIKEANVHFEIERQGLDCLQIDEFLSCALDGKYDQLKNKAPEKKQVERE